VYTTVISVTDNAGSGAGAKIFASVAALFLLCAGMVSPSAIASELRLYAGAGLRQPLERIVDDFQQTTGHRVIIDYDGSGRLLTKLRLSGQGDLFMPGDGNYIDKLSTDNVHSRRTIAIRLPVIVVNRKSPRGAGIVKLSDLARPGIRVGLGDPQAMVLGKTAVMVLERSGLQEAVLKNTVVFVATVKQLALYVAEGTVDAAIVGRPDALQFQKKVRTVMMPCELYEPDSIEVAVLNSTVDLQAACALRDFLAGSAACEVFVRFGFESPAAKRMP